MDVFGILDVSCIEFMESETKYVKSVFVSFVIKVLIVACRSYASGL